MKVELIQQTVNPIGTICQIASICYGSKEIENKEEFVKKLYLNGHHSVFEHVYFTFHITGISRACYDDKTEVLTKEGWKLFKDVTQSDLFATLSDNNEVKFYPAYDFIQYEYHGKMHKYISQNVNLCVTPNHNLYIKKYDVRTVSDFGFVPSNSIDINRFYMTKNFKYSPAVSPSIKIPGYTYTRRYKNNTTKEINTGDLILQKESFLPFMAWYLSDGCVSYNTTENSYSIIISQTQSAQNLNNGTRERIRNLIESMGFTATLDKRAVKFKNLTLGKFLKSLGHCDEKVIPWNIFEEFNQPLAKLFIDEYFKGDGHIDKNGCGKLYTSSNKLAQQLYQLCFIAGYTCKIHEVAPRGEHYINGNLVKSTKPSYVINVTLREEGRNRNVIVKKDKHFSEIDYHGMVYCVSVPNHTLFIRRDGVAVWCGNCSHQLIRHRMCSFTQRSQRYCDESQCEFILPDSVTKYPEVSDLDYQIVNTYEKLVDTYGVAKEDARYILPNACETELYLSCNLRELIHIANERLCNRAQKEIREMVKAMVKLVDKDLRFMLVPKCQSQFMICNNPCKKVKKSE